MHRGVGVMGGPVRYRWGLPNLITLCPKSGRSQASTMATQRLTPQGGKALRYVIWGSMEPTDPSALTPLMMQMRPIQFERNDSN